MKRFGQLIGLDPEQYEEYKRYHANVWPEVTAVVSKCNIRNYSIFHKDGMLFADFEYVGTDYQRDMEMMAADPITQKWWEIMKPMQRPLDTRKPDEWWANMEELFHQE